MPHPDSLCTQSLYSWVLSREGRWEVEKSEERVEEERSRFLRASSAATEAQVQNLDPLVGGVLSYIPNPPLDCNTELFNHALETINLGRNFKRERDRRVGRQLQVEGRQRECARIQSCSEDALGLRTAVYETGIAPHAELSARTPPRRAPAAGMQDTTGF